MNINKITTYSNIYYKISQLGSPQITIQPGSKELNCAVDILKLYNPSMFMNVSKIIVGPSANYGHVEAGPDRDPTVIYVNADRIVSEAGGQQSGRAAALATAQVIAHEKAHVESYDPEQGFVGGETPAEAEEQAFDAWLQSGGMSQVENLPSYQQLSS